ncbi:MAG: hypothetical protein ACLRT5_12625 [Lachnospiraceae bacterium]
MKGKAKESLLCGTEDSLSWRISEPERKKADLKDGTLPDMLQYLSAL